MTPKWIPIKAVIDQQRREIARTGGPQGIRDRGLLESAPARPQQLANYGSPDFADLAAALAFGIVRNHAFIDGNKRTSFFASVAFLRLNGLTLEHGEYQDTWFALADDKITEDQLATWFGERIKPIATKT
jgi:death on curing protein